MAYLACASHGQTLGYAKKLAKDAQYPILVRRAARGIWDIYTLSEYPLQPGQFEFKVLETDRFLN